MPRSVVLLPPISERSAMPSTVIRIPTTEELDTNGSSESDNEPAVTAEAFSEVPNISESQVSPQHKPKSTPEKAKTLRPLMFTRYTTKVILTKRTQDVYPLPFGGTIRFDEGSVQKKETVLCQAVLPEERHHLFSELGPEKALVSEIYTFDCRHRRLKTKAVLEVPFKPVDESYRVIQLQQQNSKTGYWAPADFEVLEDNRARVVSSDLGAFCVVSIPKTDVFSIPTDGCLHTCRYNRYLSIRVPKRAIESNLQCKIKVEGQRPGLVQLLLQQHGSECRHLVSVSDVYQFILPSDVFFKRKATVKLPLPSQPTEMRDSISSIAVMQYINGKWVLVPVADYRVTRTTVAIDVTQVTMFCVLRVRPNRQALSVASMEPLMQLTRQREGALLGWLYTDAERWVVRLEWVGQHEVDLVKRQRQNKEHLQLITDSEQLLSTSDGDQLFVSFQGAFSIPDLDGVYDDGMFSVHHALPENFKDFTLEPGEWDGQAQYGKFQVFLYNSDSQQKARVSEVEVMVDVDVVRAHFQRVWDREQLQREAEHAEEERLRLHELQVQQEEQERLAEQESKQRRAAAEAARFTHVHSRVKEYISNPMLAQMHVEKEVKVLSSRSLQALAVSVQRESLTLGVYLGLPQARIQALGVDALSSGLGPVEVAYRLLVMWKRATPKIRQVDDLVDALESLNREDVAEVIRHRHERHMELTPDCLPRIR